MRTRKAQEAADNLNRGKLIRSALGLEWLTVGWMVIEAAVAIGAAVQANSLTLLAFGIDSLIELISACVLLWRLKIELAEGAEFSEETERVAGRIGAVLLGLLTLYVVVSAAWGLWHGTGQDVSLVGMLLAAAAIPVMVFLAQRKLRLAKAIGSGSLRADAAESITCAYLSCVVLVGLGAQWLLGAWWVDSVTALILVPFLVKEAAEAWEGEGCGEDDGMDRAD